MKRLAVFLSTLLVFSTMLSGCSTQRVHDSSETSKPAVTSSPATTSAPLPTATPSPTPTRWPLKATPTPTHVPTATPPPTAAPIPTLPPLNEEDKEDYVLSRSITVRDLNGETFDLKAGQVIFAYSEEDMQIDLKSRFTDLSGREFLMDMTSGKYGTLYIDGIAAYDLLLSEDAMHSQQKEEISVTPWVQIHEVSESDRYVMNIDWDQDGVPDELIVEKAGNYNDEIKLSFRSGSGKEALFEQFNVDDVDKDVYTWFQFESLMLFTKSDGTYVLMISDELNQLLESSEPSGSMFITYNKDTGLQCKKTQSVFEYRDSTFFMDDYDPVFGGGSWTSEIAVTLNDDFTPTRLARVYYFLSGWLEYTYPLSDLTVEIENNGNFESYLLPAGTAFIPTREVINPDGSGYLFAGTMDNQTIRIPIYEDPDTDEFFATIYGKPAREVIYVLIGG